MGEPSGEPPKQLNVLGLPIELCCRTRSPDSFATATAIPDPWIMACIRFAHR